MSSCTVCKVKWKKIQLGAMYGALFVVSKGLSNKEEWKLKDKDSYSYEVLGGTHLSLATKVMHERQPNNSHFAGRMCRIYVGLSNEQAIYVGAMHQQSSMFQHEITYSEELFGCADVSGDPPNPGPSWRDDCSRILRKEKKKLSEVFAMARVGKDVWREFQEVNSLCEKGSLKDQKVSAGEVMRGVVSLKQWHMKPLCSLSDEQRLYLLRKVKEKEISLKELKQEAHNVRSVSQVQEAIVNFFQSKSWEEAANKFGDSVCSERLLRFRGDFEKLHEFKMFLKHLQNKTEHTINEQASGTICTGSDGVTKGQVVFSRYEDVEASSSCLENGVFLSMHAGYNSEDVIKEVSDIVDMVVRVNFNRLITIFNVIIVCPVSTCNLVVEAMTTSGAAKTQQGFIVKLGRKRETRTKDLLMTEVVNSFVVGH
ncbi:uncharacterized protein [Montipora foliosa]|uniref:uncharacterized protein n=1 Tax=Montipora foliosa TaxID=591990 RepID=UPI0035F10FCA